MIDHLPVLLIAVPIVGATLPLLVGLAADRTGWPLAALTLLVQAGLATWLGVAVATGGAVSYEVGGFAAPYGIELVVDGLSVAVVVLVAVVALGVLAYARRAGPHTDTFYSQYLLLVAGLSGMTVTGDVFNLYVFLEITGLAAYGLVATGDRPSAAVAALKYLLIGTVGASLYLFGAAYLLTATGTLNMAHLAELLGTEVAYDSTLVVTAFGLMVGGLAVKIALYPVHTWQPDAYSRAHDTVSVLISALVSTVAAYALARVLFSVFTVRFFEAVPAAQTALTVVAAVSIVAGSVLAVSQSEVQRMLAYSSVSQFGLVVGGFGVATPAAVIGGVVHLVGHAVMKGGLFGASGIVRRATGAARIEEYDGLAARAPVAAAAVAVLALAMVGVPPGVGFVGKWYIVLGALRAESWGLVAVLLASTVLTLAYFARLVERMYFTPPAGADEAHEPTVTDGGEASEASRPSSERASDGGADPVSLGMVALVVAAAVLAVALGPAVPAFEGAIEGAIQNLLNP
ncbi:monovalent cation/H+ antiporter subunit D family protein [Halomicrobium urmianum]|uniref:monovalent cation/H+ antiporter subunit D family protein n=1 Tax=Halomicrobium urmianum TaxID=1586233 RepID=UPI001CDA0E4F|nr:monovalent cation/H+ antiporter subunit D family protein [Halomicrobium urmianum]